MTAARRSRWPTRLVERGLAAAGKDYQPSDDLPLGLVASIGLTRATALARGAIRLRKPVFVGSGVRLRGKASISIGAGATLESGCVIDGYGKDGVSIGARARIGAHTIISTTSHLSTFGRGFSIGRDSGMAEFCYVGAAGGVSIGDDVIAGQFVSFHSQQHRFDDPTTLIREQGTCEEGIVVADDCWIGARTTFLDGTEVGAHSVVAAGAVVRGKFPPYSLIGGIPARVLRTLDDAGP